MAVNIIEDFWFRILDVLQPYLPVTMRKASPYLTMIHYSPSPSLRWDKLNALLLNFLNAPLSNN